MHKFRSKVFEVEAVQISRTTFASRAGWPQWLKDGVDVNLEGLPTPALRVENAAMKNPLDLANSIALYSLTPGGWIEVHFGDFLVKGTSGTCLPMTHENFLKLYEPIPVRTEPERCKDGCIYSRAMLHHGEFRRCLTCRQPEPTR